jgi:uncharacterized integral membrane protein
MIRKLVTALILVPLGILIVLFAVANRSAVTISLDPFSSPGPALTFSAPLFLVVLVALIAGVIVGGAAAWLRQSRWRRAARRREAQVAALRREADGLQRRLDDAPASVASIAYRHPHA